MTGLVNQLQSEALDPDILVSTLLRKVKVAAVKLGLSDTLEWVEAELNGYRVAPPSYREARGEPHAWDPVVERWLPIIFHDVDTANIIAKVTLTEPVGNYERLLVTEGKIVGMPMSAEMLSILNGMGDFRIVRGAIHLSRGTFSQVLDHVRNLILEWSLDLERNGVAGDGLSFSATERAIASAAHIHIGEFHGSFNSGNASGPNARINQGAADSSHNVVGDNGIFHEAEAAVRSNVHDPASASIMIDALRAMRDADASVDRASAYQRLVTAAADHITVLTPFLPVLAGLIPG